MSAEIPMERPKPYKPDRKRQIPANRLPEIDVIDFGGKPLSKGDLRRVDTGKSDIISLRKYQQVAYPPKAYEDLNDDYFFGDLTEFRMSEEKVATITGVAEQHFHTELYPLQTEGSLNIILINAPTKEDATEIVKIGSGIDSAHEAKKYALIHNLYATLFPNHFLPLETFYLDPETTGLEDPISGIKVSKVEEHPEYQSALAAAKEGDSRHIREITKYPFESVLETCYEYDIPLNFDLAARNLIIDPDGFPKLIDDIFTTCEEITPKVEYNIYRMLSERSKKIVQDHIKLLKAEAPQEELQASEAKWEEARRARRKVWQIIRAIEKVPAEDPKKNQRPAIGDFRKAA